MKKIYWAYSLCIAMHKLRLHDQRLHEHGSSVTKKTIWGWADKDESVYNKF